MFDVPVPNLQNIVYIERNPVNQIEVFFGSMDAPLDDAIVQTVDQITMNDLKKYQEYLRGQMNILDEAIAERAMIHNRKVINRRKEQQWRTDE